MSSSISEQTVIHVDITIYSVFSLFRTCYKFTDLAYIFLARSRSDSNLIEVTFTAKQPGDDLCRVREEFCNELIDQNLREALENQFGPVRDLIVAQAFAQGNLLDETTVPPSNDDLHGDH